MPVIEIEREAFLAWLRSQETHRNFNELRWAPGPIAKLIPAPEQSALLLWVRETRGEIRHTPQRWGGGYEYSSESGVSEPVPLSENYNCFRLGGAAVALPEWALTSLHMEQQSSGWTASELLEALTGEKPAPVPQPVNPRLQTRCPDGISEEEYRALRPGDRVLTVARRGWAELAWKQVTAPASWWGEITLADGTTPSAAWIYDAQL